MKFRLTFAVALLLTGGIAAAETSPYYIGARRKASATTRTSTRVDDNTQLPGHLE